MGAFKDFLSNQFGGIASAVGSVIVNERQIAANKQMQSAAQDFSASQAELNRQFQADQASTQYQRGVADMSAAGLNPALAYSQGGASAMSGSAATSTGGSVGTLENPVASYYAARQAKASTDLATASAAKARAEATNLDIRNAVERETALALREREIENLIADTKQKGESTANLVEERKNIVAQRDSIKAEIALKESQKSFTESQIKVQEQMYNKLHLEVEWLPKEKAAQIASLFASAKFSSASAEKAVGELKILGSELENYSFDHAKIMSYGDAMSLGISFAKGFNKAGGNFSLSKNSQVLVARDPDSGKLVILCEAASSAKDYKNTKRRKHYGTTEAYNDFLYQTE